MSSFLPCGTDCIVLPTLFSLQDIIKVSDLDSAQITKVRLHKDVVPSETVATLSPKYTKVIWRRDDRIKGFSFDIARMSALLDRRLQDSNRTVGRERRQTDSHQSWRCQICGRRRAHSRGSSLMWPHLHYASDLCHHNSVVGPRKHEERWTSEIAEGVLSMKKTIFFYYCEYRLYKACSNWYHLYIRKTLEKRGHKGRHIGLNTRMTMLPITHISEKGFSWLQTRVNQASDLVTD